MNGPISHNQTFTVSIQVVPQLKAGFAVLT